MKKLLLFLGLTLLISCVGDKVQDQNIVSETTTEGTQTTSESSANEDTVAETWGQIIKAPPETFFAADLSDDVRNGVTNTLLVATAEWGNYGPLEYWVLGTDLKAAQDLTELFCERRSQLGQWEKSECFSHHTDTNSNHNFESYRKKGADAIAREKPGGSMGWNGNRGWGIHLYASSYPLGFDKLFGSSPGGAQKGIFHEYFHAVQQSHIFTRDNNERWALSGPTWFVEGYERIYTEEIVKFILDGKNTGIMDVKDSLAKSLSCKHSIKANKFINKNEVDKLFHDLENCENPYTCPHGRPTIIKFTKDEIEKLFLRIM